MRRTAAVLALTLVAACGGTPTATTGEATTTTSVTAPASTASTVVTTSSPTTVTGEAPPTTPGGDPAPEFSLQLGDGSTFMLSSEQRPLFMVFWAEW